MLPALAKNYLPMRNLWKGRLRSSRTRTKQTMKVKMAHTKLSRSQWALPSQDAVKGQTIWRMTIICDR